MRSAEKEWHAASHRGRGHGGGGESPRRRLTLYLLITAIAVAITILGRDLNWQSRGRLASGRGDTANRNGDYEAARDYYEKAIANNPYDWEAHLALADILAHKLDAPGEALRCYLFALAYSPDPAIVANARGEIAILRLIRSGEMENPRHAVEDMFRAVEKGAEEAFSNRLSPRLRGESETLWKAWRERGRGRVAGQEIVDGRDGFHHASVELNFPDGVAVLLRFRCPVRDIWRLDSSFP